MVDSTKMSTFTPSLQIGSMNQYQTIYKVSGVTNEAAAVESLQKTGAAMVGYDCVKGHHDFVEMISSRAGIIPDYSSLGSRSKSDQVLRVGIFQNDMPQSIVTRIYNDQLDYVQLDGSESPVMIDNLRRTLVPDVCSRIGIIKTLAVRTREDVVEYNTYEACVDMFLFNIVVDHDPNDKVGLLTQLQLLDAYNGHTPFMVGVVDANIVSHLPFIDHPQFKGYDVSYHSLQK